jgi:hypothetical protein
MGLDIRGWFDARAPVLDSETIYVATGEVAGTVCLAFTVLLFATSLMRRKTYAQRSETQSD